MRKLITILLGLYSLSNVEAYALSLDQARTQGLVCECTNGLLVPVGAVSPEVQAFINEINAQRNQEYQKIQLSEPGTSLSQVMAIAGQQIISSVPTGTYIMDASGTCRPK